MKSSVLAWPYWLRRVHSCRSRKNAVIAHSLAQCVQQQGAPGIDDRGNEVIRPGITDADTGAVAAVVLAAARAWARRWSAAWAAASP